MGGYLTPSAPLAEVFQGLLGELGALGLVDGFEHGGDGLALSTKRMHRVADQVHDASL